MMCVDKDRIAAEIDKKECEYIESFAALIFYNPLFCKKHSLFLATLLQAHICASQHRTYPFPLIRWFPKE